MSLPIRDDEYSILVFAMHWMIEKGANSFNQFKRPLRCWLDERPAIGEGERDLILFWYQSRLAFPDFDESARIDLLYRSKEDRFFTSADMAGFAELPTMVGSPATVGVVPDESDWWFHASRVGISPKSRQAILHLVAFPYGNHWLNFGHLLLIGWDEDRSLRVNYEKPTVHPGK